MFSLYTNIWALHTPSLERPIPGLAEETLTLSILVMTNAVRLEILYLL